jgi:hypothetical protein
MQSDTIIYNEAKFPKHLPVVLRVPALIGVAIICMFSGMGHGGGPVALVYSMLAFYGLAVLIELVAVPLAIVRLYDHAGLRNKENVISTVIGAIFLLPNVLGIFAII